MIRLLTALALLLAGCTPSPPVVLTAPVAPSAGPVTPSLVTEAAKTQEQAARVAKQRDDLTNADLVQMLRLSAALKRSVHAWRAHRTAANVAAVRASIRALRGFTESGR